LSFVLWMLLTWPFTACGVDMQQVAVGLVVSLVVAVVMKELTIERYGRWLNPMRYFWAIIYFFVFFYYVIKANFDVAYRVLHPAMPIDPGIVKIRTTLKSPEARTTLANSITLTPGTLTVEITDDGVLYVHWIKVRAKDTKEAARQIIGRFEWFIRKILD